MLGCKADQVFVGGAASLNMMFDVVSRAYTHGLLHSPKPWCREEKVKFLCPAPGYDRHFQIGEFFGAELIPVPMTPEGPDMDVVEELVKDPQVTHMDGSQILQPRRNYLPDETIRRFAHLKPAAPDFAIIWDNAYGVHEFEGDYVPFPDILSVRRGGPGYGLRICVHLQDHLCRRRHFLHGCQRGQYLLFHRHFSACR